MKELQFLEDFETYCNDREALNKMRDKTRLDDNYHRVINQLNNEFSFDINELFQDSNKKIKRKLNIYHYTNLEDIIYIFKYRGLLSYLSQEQYLSGEPIYLKLVEEESYMKYKDYISCSFNKNTWYHGTYRITFKQEVENLPKACFIPKHLFNYKEHELKDYIMPIKKWPDYLAGMIELGSATITDYINYTPNYLRLEFLFYKKIPLKYIKSITSNSKKAIEELKIMIKQEFDLPQKYLNLIDEEGVS